jgi:hypothetical protein
MKQASLVATVILGVAVLLAAYAIGRLIRQARLEKTAPVPQEVTAPNDVNQADAVKMSRRINQTRPELTPEEKARIKQERAEKLEQMSNLTEAEEAQLRDEMRRELRARGAGPGRVPQLSPEDLAELRRRWPTMTDEERAAFRAKMRGNRPRAAASRPAPNEATAEQTAATASTGEPNAAGPN